MRGPMARRTDVRIVYLKGDAKTIESRLASRSGHYMAPSLLASQFAALEEPEQAMVIDIRQTAERKPRRSRPVRRVA